MCAHDPLRRQPLLRQRTASVCCSLPSSELRTPTMKCQTISAPRSTRSYPIIQTNSSSIHFHRASH
jgi:hypothetical protein